VRNRRVTAETNGTAQNFSYISILNLAQFILARDPSSSPGRVKNFLFSISSIPAVGSTQPHIQWVPGALSPGVKRPEHETDHSPKASTEVKKMWKYTSTPHTPSWLSAYLVKHRDNFTLRMLRKKLCIIFVK
jgi:hypothetical protein